MEQSHGCASLMHFEARRLIDCNHISTRTARCYILFSDEKNLCVRYAYF